MWQQNKKKNFQPGFIQCLDFCSGDLWEQVHIQLAYSACNAKHNCHVAGLLWKFHDDIQYYSEIAS